MLIIGTGFCGQRRGGKRRKNVKHYWNLSTTFMSSGEKVEEKIRRGGQQIKTIDSRKLGRTKVFGGNQVRGISSSLPQASSLNTKGKREGKGKTQIFELSAAIPDKLNFKEKVAEADVSTADEAREAPDSREDDASSSEARGGEARRRRRKRVSKQ